MYAVIPEKTFCSSLAGNKLFLAAHVGPQHLGYFHGAVGAEIVLQKRNKHSRRGGDRVIEGMGKVFSAVLAVDAYL